MSKDLTHANLVRTDKPIETRLDDRLSRGRLVNSISSQILSTNSEESITMALNAPWGAGKTSLLNLLKEHLTISESDKTSSENRAIIIPFNPWLYNNVEQLVRMFFAEFAIGIGVANHREFVKRIAKYLNLAGDAVLAIPTPPHTSWIFQIPWIKTIIGRVLKLLGAMLEREKTLPEIKQKLGDLLPKLDQKVVVFIDDIDRLESDAISIIFRMVRLVADFPNVTYVLAFDRLMVERSLTNNLGIDGRAYLEKIIQVTFDIPEADPQMIYKIINLELNSVTKTMNVRKSNEYRLEDIMYSGFLSHFRTVRHVKRYINGLRLTLAPISTEVDFVDFMVIELVRIFHPEIYLGLIRGKDKLAPTQEYSTPDDDSQEEELLEWANRLFGKSPEEFKSPLIELMKKTFPELHNAYEKDSLFASNEMHAQWRRNCRVCSPDVFDKFFLLEIPVGEISETEMENFIESLSNEETAIANFKKALHSGKASQMAIRLEDYTRIIKIENLETLIKSLLIFGDELCSTLREMAESHGDFQVPRLIDQCLGRIDSEETRFSLLLECIQNEASLFTAVQYVSIIDPNKMDQAKPQLSYSHWDMIRTETVNRIQAANEHGSLWTLERVGYILYRWIEWTSEDLVRKAVAFHIRDDDRLVDFLGRMAGKELVYGDWDRVARYNQKFELDGLKKLFDIDEVLRRLNMLSTGSGDQALRVKEYARLLNPNPTPPPINE